MVAGAVGAILVAVAAVGGAFRRFAIVDHSMAPTLEPNDWVLAKRVAGPLNRGDVVTFRDPAATGRMLVKRIIALPWERVGIETGRVTINGAVLADRWSSGVTAPEGSWVVPENHVWVLGDNRGHSTSDSRTVGPIPIDSVNWRVIGRYWPTSRAGRLGQ
jgi:signal peptidase I